MNGYVYLDNNATTSLDPEVCKAMLTDLQGPPANPSSTHFFGREAKNSLLKSRETIAKYLKVSSNEVIFTSCGTEAINMVIKGSISSKNNDHIITTDIEHLSVYKTILELEENGCQVTYLSTKPYGAPKEKQIFDAIKKNTKAIILSAVNSETGVKIDLDKIALIAKENHIPFIVDGVALLGKESFSIPEGISAMCFSGHKIHGPKGVGFAYIAKDFSFSPMIIGGYQEYNKRAGTENLSGILGLAKAVELLSTYLPDVSQKMNYLRNKLEQMILQNINNCYVNGKGPRVVNTTNISFKNVDAQSLLISLDLQKVAASHSSACSSGSFTPSRVLLNMGIDENLAKSAIRFSLSRNTTEDEIVACVKIVVESVKKLRSK